GYAVFKSGMMREHFQDLWNGTVEAEALHVPPAILLLNLKTTVTSKGGGDVQDV
ncbi:hypothetical protein E2562_027891, partial [Oryza meyeriana var. granulata]